MLKFLALKYLESRILRRKVRESLFWNLKKRIRRISSIIQRRILNHVIPRRKHSSSGLNANELRFYFIDGVQDGSNSQSGQDLFAQLVFRANGNCNYLEIGSSWPDKISNTFVLEKVCGWKGLSVDIDPNTVSVFNSKRSNLAHVADATLLNYQVFCRENAFEPRFQYLSLDIDPSFQSYLALKKIMTDGIDFSIITFEHDKYRSGSWVQMASSIILSKGRYVRVAKDIRAKNFGRYEDWWVSSLSFDLNKVAEIKFLVGLIRKQLQI